MAEATITLPDGRTATITGPSKKAILEKAQQFKAQQSAQQPSGMIGRPGESGTSPEPRVVRESIQRQPQQEEIGALKSIAITGQNRFLENLFGLPRLAGDVLAGGGAVLGAGAETVSDLVQGETPQDFSANVSERFSEEQQRFPASAFRATPVPDPSTIQAAGQTAADVVQGRGVNFDQRQQQFEAMARQAQENRPIASMIGEVLGTGATLATGRAPFAAGRARAPKTPTKPTQDLPPGVRRQIDDVIKSNVIQSLKRGGKKSAEAGLEGATLALLEEGDPVATAAFAAGGQASGSALLSLLEDMTKSRAAFVGTFMAGTAALTMITQAPPGEDQTILDSFETSAQKMTAALGLGAMSALVGAGRVRGRAAENLPVLADAITAFPRGSMIGLIEEFTAARQEGRDLSTAEAVMGKMQEDPDFFTPTERRRLERSLKNKDTKFLSTLDSLSKNKRFEAKLKEIAGE